MAQKKLIDDHLKNANSNKEQLEFAAACSSTAPTPT
jgi:hypothetical protein